MSFEANVISDTVARRDGGGAGTEAAIGWSCRDNRPCWSGKLTSWQDRGRGGNVDGAEVSAHNVGGVSGSTNFLWHFPVG